MIRLTDSSCPENVRNVRCCTFKVKYIIVFHHSKVGTSKYPGLANFIEFTFRKFMGCTRRHLFLSIQFNSQHPC